MLLSATSSVAAHDFWIYPTTFFPDTGTIVGLRLRVGEHLVGDPVPRSAALIDEFVFHDASGRKPVVGREGLDPAGLLRVAAPGLVVVGYRSTANVLDLTAEKFNQYLKEEGLDEVAALRATRRQSDAPTRERFWRCAKSLLLAGPVDARHGDRVLGLPLELVAERNPYATAPGDELSFRLTYQGTPLAGTLVQAVRRGDGRAAATARTDTAGRVTFRVTQSGMWLIKAVHTVPAPAGTEADWSSYWASLTFEIKG